MLWECMGWGEKKQGEQGVDVIKKILNPCSFDFFSYQIHSTLNLHHTLIYMNMHFSYFYYS